MGFSVSRGSEGGESVGRKRQQLSVSGSEGHGLGRDIVDVPRLVLVGCGGCGRCPLARGEQLAGGPRARFAVAGNTIEEYGWVRQSDMIWRCVSGTVQVKGWEGGNGRGRLGWASVCLLLVFPEKGRRTWVVGVGLDQGRERLHYAR